MNYKFLVRKTTHQSVEIEVEADNETDAQQLALEKADFEGCEENADYEADLVMEDDKDCAWCSNVGQHEHDGFLLCDDCFEESVEEEEENLNQADDIAEYMSHSDADPGL